MKLSRKGNTGVIFEGAAYVHSPSCSMLGVRPQTHLSTEAKAKQSYAFAVIFEKEIHLKMCFIRSFP